MIAAAHALAAQYMGMRMIYLEAGSGASKTVPDEMIRLIRSYIDIPIIVGGGIRSAAMAAKKWNAGADIVVTGNLLQKPGGMKTVREIARGMRRR
jgi:phosphoglycerol geranylgeranyltransferase